MRRRLVLLALLLAGCKFPRDAAGTMDNIEHGRMRVGYAYGARQIERRIVEDLARKLDARIEWVHGGETEMINAVKERKLDLLIAGIQQPSPWAKEVALTKPYFIDKATHKKFVMAAPPGENRWLLTLDEHLSQYRNQ